MAKYRDVLGYNGGMEIIEDKILGRFKNIKDNVYSRFGSLWLNEKNFDNHINKRLAVGHIKNRDDYISKTLECLSDSKLHPCD